MGQQECSTFVAIEQRLVCRGGGDGSEIGEHIHFEALQGLWATHAAKRFVAVEPAAGEAEAPPEDIPPPYLTAMGEKGSPLGAHDWPHVNAGGDELIGASQGVGIEMGSRSGVCRPNRCMTLKTRSMSERAQAV